MGLLPDNNGRCVASCQKFVRNMNTLIDELTASIKKKDEENKTLKDTVKEYEERIHRIDCDMRDAKIEADKERQRQLLNYPPKPIECQEDYKNSEQGCE